MVFEATRYLVGRFLRLPNHSWALVWLQPRFWGEHGSRNFRRYQLSTHISLICSYLKSYDWWENTSFPSKHPDLWKHHVHILIATNVCRIHNFHRASDTKTLSLEKLYKTTIDVHNYNWCTKSCTIKHMFLHPSISFLRVNTKASANRIGVFVIPSPVSSKKRSL